jgi:hypothetical protein
MSYNVQLLNNGNALLVRTGETVTMDEMTEINNKILTYSRQASGTFHLIADMMETRTHPNNVIELKKSIHWTDEPNLGWVIYLSQNHYLNILVDTVMSMYGQTYLVLDNLDAAMSIVMADNALCVD